MQSEPSITLDMLSKILQLQVDNCLEKDRRIRDKIETTAKIKDPAVKKSISTILMNEILISLKEKISLIHRLEQIKNHLKTVILSLN